MSLAGSVRLNKIDSSRGLVRAARLFGCAESAFVLKSDFELCSNGKLY